jgi:hypothetical protein
MTTIANYFTMPPDWAEGVKYSRAWRTSIINTAVGTEQRAALFTWPRRSLEYTVAGMSSGDNNYIKRKFFQGQGTVYGVPLWISMTTLYESAAAAQPFVTAVSITGHEFVQGGELILLGSGPDTFEVGEIDSLMALESGPPDYTPVLLITLAENLAAAWPSGTSVLPVLPCRIRPEQQIEALAAEIVQTRIEAQEAFEA